MKPEEDYDAINAELDKKILENYTSSSDPEATETAEGTSNEEVAETQAKEATEATVPESRYRNAVLKMNQALQEAAALRKENEVLRNQTDSNPALNKTSLESPEKADSLPALGGDSEKMALLREDFPEIADVIDELRAELSTVNSSVASLSGSYQSNLERQNALYWKTVSRALPGLNIAELQVKPEFQAWRFEQSPEVEAMLTSDDPQDLIDGLKKYMQDTGAAKKPATPEAAPTPELASPTVIDLTIAKTPPVDKLALAQKEAAPDLNSSSRMTSSKPFKRLSREEYSRLSADELDNYNQALDEHLMKQRA